MLNEVLTYYAYRSSLMVSMVSPDCRNSSLVGTWETAKRGIASRRKMMDRFADHDVLVLSRILLLQWGSESLSIIISES